MIIAHIHHSDSLSFWGGFTHSLTGWDHLVMLISVGIFASRHRHCFQKIMGTVVAGLLLGGCLGSVMHGAFPIEFLIGVTLAVCGIFLVWRREEKSESKILASVSLVAIIHGMAHGVEMNGFNPIPFLGGMVTCAFLIIAGVGQLFTIRKNQWRKVHH